ncbi:MAG: phage terminase small subunit P27 family [Cyclobacteriaceae bacterium]
MKATSADKKKNKGTFRQNREKGFIDMELINDLAPPKELNEAARVEWNMIAPVLTEQKLLTNADRRMLTAYCIEMARYFDYNSAIDIEGPMLELKDKKGKVVNYMKNPLCDLAAKSLQAATSIAASFGLTPFSRGKLKAPDSPKDSPEKLILNKLSSLRAKSGKVVKMKSA